jgi:hypothetical protein
MVPGSIPGGRILQSSFSMSSFIVCPMATRNMLCQTRFSSADCMTHACQHLQTCRPTWNDPGRTRACNPRLRRPMPYPLGHGACAAPCYLSFHPCSDKRLIYFLDVETHAYSNKERSINTTHIAIKCGFAFLLPIAKWSFSNLQRNHACFQYGHTGIWTQGLLRAKRMWYHYTMCPVTICGDRSEDGSTALFTTVHVAPN